MASNWLEGVFVYVYSLRKKKKKIKLCLYTWLFIRTNWLNIG